MYAKMAAANKSCGLLDLKASKHGEERGEKFWNTSVSEMKFTVEQEWIKAVRKAKHKPNYGMLNMDDQLEEIIGNKLELVGPIIDCYLREIGKSLQSKLKRSKATGLVNPVSLFIPWANFRHILTLCRGYSGEIISSRDGAKHMVTFSQMRSIKKLFSPARFSDETWFATRHFKKIPSMTGRKRESVYNGKSVIVISKYTPFCVDYSMKSQKVNVSFYIQRYTGDNYALDSGLQALMNLSSN